MIRGDMKEEKHSLSDDIEYIYERGDDKDYVIPIESIKKAVKNYIKRLRRLGVSIPDIIGVDLAIYELKEEFGEKLTK